MLDKIKMTVGIGGALVGMVGCFALPVGLLGENGAVAAIGAVCFILGLLSTEAL